MALLVSHIKRARSRTVLELPSSLLTLACTFLLKHSGYIYNVRGTIWATWHLIATLYHVSIQGTDLASSGQLQAAALGTLTGWVNHPFHQVCGSPHFHVIGSFVHRGIQYLPKTYTWWCVWWMWFKTSRQWGSRRCKLGWNILTPSPLGHFPWSAPSLLTWWESVWEKRNTMHDCACMRGSGYICMHAWPNDQICCRWVWLTLCM